MADTTKTGIKKAHPFYKTRLWKERRLAFLERNALCVRCLEHNRLTPATVVHHIEPHRGDWRIFKDESNWRAVCKKCHDSKEQSIERMGYDKGVGADGWPVDPKHPVNKRAS